MPIYYFDVNVTIRIYVNYAECYRLLLMCVYFHFQTNTFQLVLLSDGTDSYAIFNYGDIQISPDRFDQVFNNGFLVSHHDTESFMCRQQMIANIFITKQTDSSFIPKQTRK